MTVASIGSQSDLIVAAAARGVIADFTYAQTRAISLRKKVFIQQTANQYALLSRDTDASAMTLLKNPISHDSYVTAFQTGTGSLRNVSLSGWNFGSVSMIGFDELGCPFTYDVAQNKSVSMTSSGSLSLTSDAAKVTINVQPFTGELTAE